jgi:hypothetical protein
MNDPKVARRPTCNAYQGEPAAVGSEWTRRTFLAGAGALAASVVAPRWAFADEAGAVPVVETKVKELFDSLNSDQKKALCFPLRDPLRRKVAANWDITKSKIEDLDPAQQDLVEEIVRGLHSEQGFEQLEVHMNDDAGGLGQYHIALFGRPGDADFQFVLTGRHATMRADGNREDKVAFGGPMVYGHAHGSFHEPPDHKGNVYWYQALRANEVFSALDPPQRAKALVREAPAEDKIDHRTGGYDGIAVGELSADQKALVQAVMNDLLSPYRKQDVDEVMEILTANGGLDKIHLAFYQSGDVGDDGVWDVWRLEGPEFVWHFRGAPHVHTWVNIGQAAKA